PRCQPFQCQQLLSASLRRQSAPHSREGRPGNNRLSVRQSSLPKEPRIVPHNWEVTSWSKRGLPDSYTRLAHFLSSGCRKTWETTNPRTRFEERVDWQTSQTVGSFHRAPVPQKKPRFAHFHDLWPQRGISDGSRGFSRACYKRPTSLTSQRFHFA